MTGLHYIGAVFVLALITGVGIYSGHKVKTSGDFSNGGGRAGAGIVAGTIMGTLVGGSSTIGTAQLAYKFGFSAWWYTLGAGIGCLMLGAFFAGPIRQKKVSTLPQALSNEYGRPAGTLSTILVSLGIFVNIIAQLLAGIALITSVIGLSPIQASLITASLMLCYVVFGGVWGTGFVGIAKLILLYAAVIFMGFLALRLGGGVNSFAAALPTRQYFNLFARGMFVDIGAGISLILGVISTQTYIQAILSAKNDKEAKKGAFISAILIPPVGLAGIFIGMYMKLHFPSLSQASATLPVSVMQNMPPMLAGMIMATLLVAVVGTGSGLALGISSILCQDIFKVYIKKDASDKAMLTATRVAIAAVLGLAVIFTTGNLGSLILEWSFMSMGLRAAVIFAPLCGALFFAGRVDKRFAVLAMVAGPLFVFIGKLILPPAIDSLFLGVGISLVVMLPGLKNKKAA